MMELRSGRTDWSLTDLLEQVGVCVVEGRVDGIFVPFFNVFWGWFSV